MEQLRAGLNRPGTDPFRFEKEGFVPKSQRDIALSGLLSGKPVYSLDPTRTANIFEKGVAKPARTAFAREMKTFGSDFNLQSGGALFSSRLDQERERSRTAFEGELATQLAQTQMQNEQLMAQIGDAAADRQLQATQVLDPNRVAAERYAALLPFQEREQAMKDFEFEEYQRGQIENTPLLGLLGDYALQQTQQPYEKAGSGGVGDIMGSVGSGMSMLAGAPAAMEGGAALLAAIPAMFSDVRLKKNIVLVGTSDSGINIYEFNYNDKEHGVGRFRGVLAHEVPDASFKDSDGLLSVDYSKLDVDFERIQ